MLTSLPPSLKNEVTFWKTNLNEFACQYVVSLVNWIYDWMSKAISILKAVSSELTYQYQCGSRRSDPVRFQWCISTPAWKRRARHCYTNAKRIGCKMNRPLHCHCGFPRSTPCLEVEEMAVVSEASLDGKKLTVLEKYGQELGVLRVHLPIAKRLTKLDWQLRVLPTQRPR